MKKIIVFMVVILIIYCNALFAAPLSGRDILEKVDKNFIAANRISTSTMIIKGRRGTRRVKSTSWIQGTENAFTEYLSPAREKGTKMLKIKDELWTWTPSADRIIKIAGHMLRQSLLGSDVSYDDFMEDPILNNIYDAKIIGEEKVDDRLCYVLELTAKTDKVAYYSRKLWIDQDRYLPLREDRFARSGKLIKTIKIQEVFKTGNRWYPKKMVFKDVLKKGSGTEFIIDSVTFNAKIPKHIFSKASLRR